MIEIALLITAIYILALIILYLFQGRMIFNAKTGMSKTPASRHLSYEQHMITCTDDVRLCAWFFPSEESPNCLLFFHGNSDCLSDLVDALADLRGLGINVLAIDYRGYGLSNGKPSEDGLYLDAEACWAWLIAIKGFRPDQIVLHGRSLGGALAAFLAARHRPAALILESTFTSMTDLVRLHYRWIPTRLLLQHRFPTSKRIKDIKAPTLVIHSTADELIPFSQAEKLKCILGERGTLLSIQGLHYDGYQTSGKKYLAGIKGFLAHHGFHTDQSALKGDSEPPLYT